MTTIDPAPRALSLLGLGDMGAALGHAWLDAGHPLTVWNRTAGKARPLAAKGATVAPTAADAVAAADLVVVCLLDDASVDQVLAGTDISGKDLVNLTTGTPGEARARAAWAAERGARLLDGGIMAVPPMIGVPDSGAYVFYSGPKEVFEAHRETLAVPAGAVHVGEDAGMAALHDVALLSAMLGIMSGMAHAYALFRREKTPPARLAGPLADWVAGMAASYARELAEHLECGDYTRDVTSNLAMMVRANATLLRTAEEQGVGTELLEPYMRLMERRLAEGHAAEGTAGVVDLLLR